MRDYSHYPSQATVRPERSRTATLTDESSISGAESLVHTLVDILEPELANVGANPGRTAFDLFDLGNPALDWIHLAEAMGVEAARAETLEGLASLLAVNNQREGPFLIELVIP